MSGLQLWAWTRPAPSLVPKLWASPCGGAATPSSPLGTEALVGVCVSEEHPHSAEFVEQPQADAWRQSQNCYTVPSSCLWAEPGLPPVREGCQAGMQPSGLCSHPARPTWQEESAIDVTYPVSSRPLRWGRGQAGAAATATPGGDDDVYGVGRSLVVRRGWPWGRGLLGRGQAGPHLPWWRSVLWPAASCYDAFPQLQWDVGDVVGAGDGRAVQGGQVGRLDWRPTSQSAGQSPPASGQHHQGIGVIEGQGRPRVRGCRSHKESVCPAWPGPVESEAQGL